MDEESLMRKILSGELMFAKVWLVCVALRGVNWDKMPFEQRELAFQAKEAASNCLATFLQSPEYRYAMLSVSSVVRHCSLSFELYRAALRYAVHDSLVTAAFSGLFLLKIANLFPGEVDINAITLQVEQLAHLLSEVAAERFVEAIRNCLQSQFTHPRATTPDTLLPFASCSQISVARLGCNPFNLLHPLPAQEKHWLVRTGNRNLRLKQPTSLWRTLDSAGRMVFSAQPIYQCGFKKRYGFPPHSVHTS